MQKIVLRGGKFDGRTRDYGSPPADLLEVPVGNDKTLQYLRTDKVEGDAVVYELVGDAPGVDVEKKLLHASLPFIVHFHGGPFNRKGRAFSAEPAEHLVLPIPTEDTAQTRKFSGAFAKYQRAKEQLPGRPLVYHHVKNFRGEE